MDIKNQLEELGLGGKKADVYLAVLQLGKASVMQIAKKARIKRPTTYDVLEDLLAKNLVSQTFDGKKRYFVAEDPKNLKLMIQEQENKVDQVLPELESLFNLIPHKPKIRYYEGAEGVKQIYEEYLKSKEKITYYFGSVKDEIELLGKDYMQDWVERRIKKGIKVKAIRLKEREMPIKKFGHGQKFLRDLKFFPLEITEPFNNIVIFDNKVAITSSKKESYGVIIESAELATTLKYIWQVVWEVSKSK
ncbi:MAG: hypothetical protein GF365_01045 [Candidatus Buchananbacteria bacterium]|nr:hypothetical protein [Candidatus Buchananbacteria bacterium]